MYINFFLFSLLFRKTRSSYITLYENTKMPLLTQFEAYLLTEKRVAANTLAAYKNDLEQFQSFLSKRSLTLELVKDADIRAFLQYLKALNIGPRSMARKISSIRLLYKYCHDKFNWDDVAEDISIPKYKKGLPNYLSEHEIEALLRVAEEDTSQLGVRNKIMLYLLYVTGMRISEMVSLEVSAIHFDTGVLVVKGKGDKERMIPMPASMCDFLRIYIKDYLSIFTDKRPTNYLFPTFYAGKIKPITRQAFWIILNAMWKKTGIQKTISPHTLRHSLATHMLKNGAHIRALQMLLGHENISTVQVYTHVEVTHIRKVYDEKHPRSE
jgi:integrase/recombinase XerD